ASPSDEPTSRRADELRSGFTVLELILFTAIFVGTGVIFITILLTITRVHVRQSAVAEVNQQSQFLLQTIQRNVASASLIEMQTDVATATLKLRMANPA